MRNRWGVEIKKGYHAWGTWGNSRAPIDGTISRIDQTSDFARAYGAQVTLRNSRGDEYTIGADEISEVLPPMRVVRGGVVRANPKERNVRATNPDFSVSDFRRELKAGPYAWPGGYPRYFVTSDGEALSFKDAKENARLIMEAIRDRDNSGWRVVGVDVNWEDEDLYSAHSGERIESAYGENSTPRLTRYDQPSQRERINPRTGRPTKTPSKRLKNRRLATHHFAPPGVWANPLTRVKLKSPAQRSGNDPSPRLLKRRKVTAKAPPGFYANPIKGAIKFANIERETDYVFGVDAVTPVTFVFTERERTARGKWYKSYRLPDWLINSSEFQQWANANVRVVMSLNELKKFLSGFQK